MRFLIVTYDEYINIPYIEKYERSILAQGGSYDVILWDRRNCIQDVKPNWFVFKGRTGKGKLTKALPFLRWRHFVCHCLRADCYDRLIVLTTIPAILLRVLYTPPKFFKPLSAASSLVHTRPAA